MMDLYKETRMNLGADSMTHEMETASEAITDYEFAKKTFAVAA